MIRAMQYQLNNRLTNRHASRYYELLIACNINTAYIAHKFSTAISILRSNKLVDYMQQPTGFQVAVKSLTT